MRSLALPALLLAVVTGGCTPLFTIHVQPTHALLATSKRPVALESRRVRVVHLEEPTLVAGSSAPRSDVAVAAAQKALLDAGWSPTMRVADDAWVDDDAPENRLVVLYVRSGVDILHTLDGCQTGNHFYPFWVEVAVALLDADGEARWTGRALVRSSDLLTEPIVAEASTADDVRCDHVSAAHPFWSTPALLELACFGSADRCAGRVLPLSPFLDAAFEELVRALDSRSAISRARDDG